MKNVRFYRLSVTPLLKALPKLLEKILDQKKKCQTILYTEDVSSLQKINESLWTYTPMGFLPHGMHTDDHPEDQPVLLCASTDPIIQGKGCVSLDPIAFFDVALDPLIYIFEGDRAAPFQNLAEKYKEKDYTVSIMIQGTNGAWEVSSS